MIPKIVKVSPSENYFSITWLISRRCNYDCSYCPTIWHDNTSKHKTLIELQNNWRDIYEKSKDRNLKYKISFTGGELTANKNFYSFLTWLKEKYGDKIYQILLTTNGSATYDYYLKLFDAIDNISFSLHSEHLNEKKFFETIIKLQNCISKDKFLHVNIMNEWWNKDRIPKYVEILKQHNISYEINEINYQLGTRKTPNIKGKLNLEL